jgi:hypothetical protein
MAIRVHLNKKINKNTYFFKNKIKLKFKKKKKKLKGWPGYPQPPPVALPGVAARHPQWLGVAQPSLLIFFFEFFFILKKK